MNVSDLDHEGPFRKIVEQGVQFVEEQRQVVFEAGRGDAVADIAINRALPGIYVETVLETSPEAADRGRIERKLAPRQQAYLLNPFPRPLGFRVEAAQGFDFFVEQVDADRFRAAHGKQIDHGTAYGELGVVEHGIDRGITRGNQLSAELLDRQPLADSQIQAVGGHMISRRQTQQQPGHGKHQDALLQQGKPVQGRQALGNDVLVRREVIVGQGFPVRQAEYGQIFMPAQVIAQLP